MQKYKKFFIRTFIIFIISMIVFPLSFLLWIDYMIGRHHYSKTADYVNYLIEQKKQIAKKYDAKGKKIVFLSGSNTLYGINSKYMHEKTGLPILNYGLHAGFEHYIFYESKKILKSGDIVVLPLEFSLYKKDADTIPAQLAEYLVTYGHDYYKDLSLVQKLGLSFYLIKLIITYHKLDADKLDETILSQTNDYGDFVSNKGNLPNIKKEKKYISITAAIPQNNKNFSLYDFIQFCKKNNIKVYATLPYHYHKQEYTESEKSAYENIRSFYEKNGIQMLGDIKSGAVYEEDLVYDFGYHANDIGQKLHSDRMIKLLSSIDLD